MSQQLIKYDLFYSLSVNMQLEKEQQHALLLLNDRADMLSLRNFGKSSVEVQLDNLTTGTLKHEKIWIIFSPRKLAVHTLNEYDLYYLSAPEQHCKVIIFSFYCNYCPQKCVYSMFVCVCTIRYADKKIGKNLTFMNLNLFFYLAHCHIFENKHHCYLPNWCLPAMLLTNLAFVSELDDLYHLTGHA